MSRCDIAKMSECFYCGELKNEIVIAKKLDRKWCDNKKMSIIIDYEPCDKCKEEFSKGVLLLEVMDKPLSKNQPSLDKKETIYPTGAYWVVSEESLSNDIYKKGTRFLITPEAAKEIGLYNAQKQK